jgi:hypothetical protein
MSILNHSILPTATLHLIPVTYSSTLSQRMCHLHILPFAKAAVDVHVTSSFSSQSVGDSSYTVPITKHLQKASTFVNGEMVVLL